MFKTVFEYEPPLKIMFSSCEFTKSYFVVKKTGVKRLY